MSDQEKQDKQKQGKSSSNVKPVVGHNAKLFWVDATGKETPIAVGPFEFSVSFKRDVRRKDGFEPYTEPFRTFTQEEYKSYFRAGRKDIFPHIPKVSYQALPGGFTICNVLLDGRLFSGCSHCIKSDRWLPIRGKMQAFRRAVEQSEGVSIVSEESIRPTAGPMIVDPVKTIID